MVISAPFYDGVPHITQCPISPHTTFRYTFTANEVGTHWWHSHTGLQRADGAFGALIVREPNAEIPTLTRNTYDYDSVEYLMVIQHWDIKTAAEKFVNFHFTDSDNHPSNILINGKGPLQNKINVSNVKTSKYVTHEVYHVEEKSKYRFRIINAGYAICPVEISIDNHTLNVIASDGNYIEPVSVDSLIAFSGERFDIAVVADQPIGNYWIRVKGLLDCDERYKKAHQAAVLRYNGAKIELPTVKLSYDFHRSGLQMNSLNRGSGYNDSISIAETISLAPDIPSLLQKDTDFKFYIHFDLFPNDYPGFNNTYSERFDGPQFNQITMKMPPVPFLIAGKQNDESKFCSEEFFTERNISCLHNFCECPYVYQIPLNATVELILIDGEFELAYGMNHPLHLHGHSFRVVGMERVKKGGLSLEEVSVISVQSVCLVTRIKKNVFF